MTFGWPSCDRGSTRGSPPATGYNTIRSLCAQRVGSSLTVAAIQRPSGEKLGDVSAASVAANGVTLPLATSTIARSAEGQWSTTGELTWLTIIFVPSGDQSSDETWRSSTVSLRGSRLPSAPFARETT